MTILVILGILFLIVIYLIIGRSLMLIFYRKDIIDLGDNSFAEEFNLFFATIFFPIILFWIFIRSISDYIADLF